MVYLFVGYFLVVVSTILCGVDVGIGLQMASVLPFGVPQFLYDEDVDGGNSGDGNGEGESGSDVKPDVGDGSEGGKDEGDGFERSLDALVTETNETFEEDGKTVEKKDDGEDDVKGDGSETEGGDGDGIEYKEGFDPNDLVEIEGGEDKFFYHPTVHGKDTGQGSTYKKRDDAEYALGAKSAKLHELVKGLNESGKGVGAVDLPEWFGEPTTPDDILEAGNIEAAVELPNEDLRGRVKEMDTLITSLSGRNKRITTEQDSTKAMEDFEAKKEDYATRLQGVMDDLGIGDKEITIDFNTDNPLERLRSELKDARDKRVAKDLKEPVQDYKEYKENSNARIDDDEYADKLEKKYKDIQTKRGELEQKYNEKLNITDEIMELGKSMPDVTQDVEETKAQQTKRIAGVLKELGKEHEHPMFETNDATGVQQFFRFVFDNSQKYNGVHTTYDAYKALKDFDSRADELRRKARIASVEDKNTASDKKKDIPGYGDQKRLGTSDKAVDVRETNRKQLEELEKETNAKLGE